MAKVDLFDSQWVDMVFEGKNQAYGAYVLRKGTSKRNIMSLLIVIAAGILAFIGLNIVRTIQANRSVENLEVVEVASIKEKKQAKKLEEEVKKIEPEKIVEKVKSSIKFTAPVVKKDNEVKEEDVIDLEKIEKTNTTIGAFTVEGNDEVGGEILKAKEEIAAPEPPKDEHKVFEVVEQMPSFPGGEAALTAFLSSNTKYPEIALENNIQGRVVVKFIVEKNGSITDVHVVKSVDPSLDKEAVRVVKSMPKWTPGKQNGQAVRVQYMVPVTFKLQ